MNFELEFENPEMGGWYLFIGLEKFEEQDALIVPLLNHIPNTSSGRAKNKTSRGITGNHVFLLNDTYTVRIAGDTMR